MASSCVRFCDSAQPSPRPPCPAPLPCWFEERESPHEHRAATLENQGEPRQLREPQAGSQKARQAAKSQDPKEDGRHAGQAAPRLPMGGYEKLGLVQVPPTAAGNETRATVGVGRRGGNRERWAGIRREKTRDEGRIISHKGGLFFPGEEEEERPSARLKPLTRSSGWSSEWAGELVPGRRVGSASPGSAPNGGRSHRSKESGGQPASTQG